ncbi:hypothetical protein PQ478_11920 [Alkalihalophilus pseudofirmus]|uniref:hypothetical protein n=1 Tax=Alkalihalophilus pseudofirmus TaxID=79885 RepID=UPI00259B0967|nr:hypothetical protein [Alkalihalophilus pseudofirmus]WEG15247.1 hypothetical protein PQ478_11920 [Alkalihalophilus pseudofirmus]
MQINKEIKYRDLPKAIQQHLHVFASFQTKQIIGGFTFILLNFSLFPLLVPFTYLYAALTVPLIIIINLWSIYLLFRSPYTIQVHVFLFLGMLSIVAAWAYTVAVQKYAYIILNVQGPLFLFLTVGIQVVLIVVMYLYYKGKMLNLDGQRNIKQPSKLTYILYGAGPALGYIFYHQVAKQSEMAMLMALLGVFYMFALVFSYTSVKFIHKYLFMRANSHLVKLEKPLKKSKQHHIEVK